MKDRFRRLMPTQESLRASRWLRWLGPTLFHPRLWHMSRRGIALGMSLGVFFGLLIPIAQIPLTVAAATVLRANIPTAVASTLVTNPVTFGPVYYAAWRVGGAVLGEPVDASGPANSVHRPPGAVERGWAGSTLTYLTGVGRPLAVGLVIFAVVAGIGTYLIVSAGWYVRVRWARRRRRGQGARGRGTGSGSTD
jgi:uncharacterized protein (DUF2062 family)